MRRLEDKEEFSCSADPFHSLQAKPKGVHSTGFTCRVFIHFFSPLRGRAVLQNTSYFWRGVSMLNQSEVNLSPSGSNSSTALWRRSPSYQDLQPPAIQNSTPTTTTIPRFMSVWTKPNASAVYRRRRRAAGDFCGLTRVNHVREVENEAKLSADK